VIDEIDRIINYVQLINDEYRNRTEEDLLREFNTSFTKERIQKQIDNIEDMAVREKLQQSFESEKLLLIHSFMDVVNYAPKEIGNFKVDLGKISLGILKLDESDFALFYQKIRILIKSDVFLLDIYFLARCFRTFKGIRGGVLPDSPRNIIANFGNHHIKHITEILLEMNGKLIKSVNDNGNFCVNIGLKGPIFNDDNWI
jgi:hypothetical protein